MSVTYSINQDSSIESTRKVDINSVLQSLPNNTQKLIRPRDVRDGFLSTWSNSVFKITSPQNSSLEYIGLDSGNPNNRDIKNKILIGKRNFGNIDIMNNQLLNSNTDIFFYNTKSDEQNQSSTKIGILAGTQSNLDAPYFESFATASQFNFNIVNPSGGDVSIKSTTGNLFLNDIPFPKVSESPNDGDVLKYSGVYPLGKLEWGQADIAVTSTIGTPEQETNIFGSEVFLNGYSLEFVNDTLVPLKIGGIEQGSSFPSGSFQGQNWPLSEIIRELIYPYIPPKLEISIFDQNTGYPYGDIGFQSLVTITYSITTFARESSEDLFDTEILKLPSDSILDIGVFSGIPGTSTFSTIENFDVQPTSNEVIFQIKSKNEIDGTTFETTSNATFSFIKPFIMLVIPDNYQNIDDDDIVNGTPTAANIIDSYINNQSQLDVDDRFSKTILPYENSNTIIRMETIPNNVSSYLYFVYPFEYPEILGIRDVFSGFISSPQSFTYSNTSVILQNPYDRYRIYKSLNPVLITPSVDKFELLFGGVVSSSPSQNNLINDNWRFVSSFSPGDTGYIVCDNFNFNQSTTGIRISHTSFNNNNYNLLFTQFSLGTIIKVSFGGRFINYVILGFNINPEFLTIGIQYIPGQFNQLPANFGNLIQFELLTL
jgi:hypothetical protein